MTPHDRLLIRAGIEDLIAEFAWRIDHDQSDTVADLFTEDGWYGREGGARSVGRDAIRKAYANRTGHGPRTARHIFTNLRLSQLSPDAASGTCILLLFAADGLPPLPATPILVQDYEDTYARIGDRWLFASRRTVRLFVGEGFQPVLQLGDRQA